MTQDDCKQETRRLEGELGELQDTHNRVTEEKHKLESKYRTLSKANSAAIADAENLKQDNKKLRTQLHEATTSKTSELIDLKDKLEKMTQGNNLRWSILLKVTISVGPFSKFNRVLRLKLNVKLWFPLSPGRRSMATQSHKWCTGKPYNRSKDNECRKNQSPFNKNKSSKDKKLNFEKCNFLGAIFRTYTGTQHDFL